MSSHDATRTRSRARRLPPGRSRAMGRAILLTLCVSLVACTSGPSSESKTAGEITHVQSVDVPAPVDLDLDALRERGTLRVLLRNSSSSYYILRGEEYGFEFELAREVADALGLRLRVVLPDSTTDPLQALLRGEVDLVALPFPASSQRLEHVVPTRSYDSAQDVIVTRAELADELDAPEDLDGRMVAARRLSSGEERLFELRREGIPVGIVMHAPQTAVDELLDMVADGTYPAAAADDRALASALRFRPNLVRAFSLGEPRPLHWLVRSTSPRLLVEIDAVIERHYRPREDGTHAGSEFYNVVRNRYFADETQIQSHASDPFRLSQTGRVSPFDDAFRAAADSVDVDWRLLAAIAFQESRFDPEVESWAGAIGVMQVRPTTARLDAVLLRDAEINIAAGARHLRELLDLYDYLPESDRLRFALAAYNCGQGHLDDARILSLKRGKDPNQWEGSVRESLLLLRKPQYYHEARYGYVRGNETVAYVREVERRYDLLSRLVTPARPAPTATVTWGATR